MDYLSGRLLKDAELIGELLSESENLFVHAMGSRLLEMAAEQDVHAILEFRNGIEASMPGIWEDYWGM